MSFELPTVHETEVARIKGTYLSELTALTPDLADAGRDLFERISTPNWALEWGLPHWLGRMFDWPVEAERELLLSNIYMLAFARLADDLADGENSLPGNTATVLSAVLHHLWIRQYERLFDGSHLPESAGDRRRPERFWTYFDAYMAEWLQATLNSGQRLGRAFGSFTEADFMRLAEGGAYLKTCCAAACVLSGREGDIASLAAVLGQVMVGVALLDGEFDWVEDLEAGRYNAFVAYCSDLPQTMEHRQANRHAVLKEIYLGEAARPYFDLTCRRMDHAATSAQLAGCLGLRDFITWYREEVKACGRWLAEKAEAQMRLVLGPLLTTPLDHDMADYGLSAVEPGRDPRSIGGGG